MLQLFYKSVHVRQIFCRPLRKKFCSFARCWPSVNLVICGGKKCKEHVMVKLIGLPWHG